MTTKQANSEAQKIFNYWIREIRPQQEATQDYYSKKELLKNRCIKLHNVEGVYTVLSDKNALKMASVCSAIRFVKPYRMLMKLQHTTNSY